MNGNVTHGHAGRKSRTPEYMAWRGMKDRCFNLKNSNFPRYGGRGITVCDEWRNDFAAFLAHIGLRPSDIHSLDRINNDGNYEPGNVRWATKLEQIKNRDPKLVFGERVERILQPCLKCNKLMGLIPFEVKDGKRYCSYKCSTSSVIKQLKKFKKRIEVNCEECGLKMELLPYEIRKGRRFCSNRCVRRAISQRAARAK